MKWKIIILCLFSLLLISCKTEYVPVVEHHYHDSIRVVKQTDSIYREHTMYVKDSMAMENRGDTTIIKYYHNESTFDYNNMLHAILDSVGTSKRDSIPIPYPVEKKLTKWQQFKMDMGEVLFSIAILGIIALVLFICSKLKILKI